MTFSPRIALTLAFLASTSVQAGMPCLSQFASLAPLTPFQMSEAHSRTIQTRFKNMLPAATQKAQAPNAPLTASEFHALYSALETEARRYGIELVQKTETIGVFPEGLGRLGISGFNLIEGSKIPSSIERHELAHLVHTIELRVLVIESFGKKQISELTPTELTLATDWLKTWEQKGLNYSEFEKIASRASSLIHSLPSERLRSREAYIRQLELLIEGTALALDTGKVRFPNQWTLEGTYAWFLSRLPFIVGRSAGELPIRIPILAFAVAYVTDYDLQAIYPRAKFPPDHKDARHAEKVGFRQWIHAWIAHEAKQS